MSYFHSRLFAWEMNIGGGSSCFYSVGWWDNIHNHVISFDGSVCKKRLVMKFIFLASVLFSSSLRASHLLWIFWHSVAMFVFVFSNRVTILSHQDFRGGTFTLSQTLFSRSEFLSAFAFPISQNILSWVPFSYFKMDQALMMALNRELVSSR